jgi:cytidylate kinase
VGRSVVCISGATGAGADEIAPVVADRLGFRLVDEGIVARAAREAGVEHHVVADVELRKSFVARLLRDLGASSASVAASSGFPIPGGDTGLSADDLRTLIRSAVEETADQGRVVIASHAASVALAGRDDVLRVLVTGSPEARAARVARSRSLPEEESAGVVAAEDAARADYLRRFYDVRAELPTHYDLVLNTDRLGPAEAAELVVRAASAAAG